MLGLFLKSLYAFTDNIQFKNGKVMPVREMEIYLSLATKTEFNTPLHLACQFVFLIFDKIFTI
jgi:hypothetical protein